MFLILSKLLPLLVYPLGLSCLLLLLALVWLWRYPRYSGAAIAAALLIIFCSSNPYIASRLMRSLEWRYLPPNPVPQVQAIVVLGGCTDVLSPPRSSIEIKDSGDRVLHGVRLYQQGAAPLLIFSGGRLDWHSAAASEAQDMSALAQEMGVPASAILRDDASRNTYENAVNTAAILQEQNIERFLLVTSAFHMPRSMAIFRKQGLGPIAAPTDYWVTEQLLASMRGLSVATVLNALPDSEALHFSTRALKEYIGLLVYRLRGWL